MKKVSILVFIGFLCGTSLYGQIQEEVNKILATHDFVAFNKYTSDVRSNRKQQVSIYQKGLRDLTNDYQEGVFFIEKSVHEEGNTSVGTIYTYRINLIATATTIIFYELSEEKNKQVGNSWVPFYDIIYNYKNEKSYDSLKISFKKIFKTELNEEELFMTEFVYGGLCGMVGMRTEGGIETAVWVAEKNKEALLQWLTSAHTEKQIYALEGLYQLRKLKIELTSAELEMIRFVMNKKGTIYTCSGCIYSYNQIKSITKEFKF